MPPIDLLQVLAFGIVQAGRRLVHQQEARPHGDGAGNADPPLLAEGQGVDLAGAPCAARPSQSSTSHRLARAPLRGRARSPCAPASTFSSAVRPAKGSTFWKVRTSPRRLRSCGFQRADVLAVQMHAAAVDLLEAGEHIDQRRLAGAVRPDQAEDLAAVEPQADAGRSRAGPGS